MKFLVLTVVLAMAVISVIGAPTTVLPPELVEDAQDDATATPQADEPVTVVVPADAAPSVVADADDVVHFDDVVAVVKDAPAPTSLPDENKESNDV